MTRINPDDPRLTALALGELDQTERAEIEAALADSPEARDRVEEITALARQLTEELGADDNESLSMSASQRAALEARLDDASQPGPRPAAAPAEADNVHQLDPQQPRRRPWILRRRAVLLAMAACCMLVIGVTLGVKHQSKLFFNRTIPPSSSIATENEQTRHKGDEGKMGGRWLRRKGAGQYGLRGPAPSSTSGDAHGGLTITTAPGQHRVVLSHRGYDRNVRVIVDGKSIDGYVDGEATDKTIAKNDRGGDDPAPGESYQRIVERGFELVAQRPLSTFSVDVDTAAYANVRRFLARETLPPPDAVRIEEMINYFDYRYPGPTGNHPFSVNVEVASTPWKPAHRLVRIGLQGRRMRHDRRPVSNLVFLVDVSGSMSAHNKLPLLRQALTLLVDQLGEKDRVALAVYAGASGLVLPSTPCSRANRPKILSAIERLEAGGSTNGGAGIELAYNTAVQNFLQGGANRVILATDGDFNVGVTDRSQLVRLIQRRAKSGVFLSVLGFGMGNYKDATLEQLADKGNGNYAYIDTINEARKVLVEQLSGTLVTIAKDVKIQVEFNPARVSAYRLIGYENRRLAARDFNDDRKDAGEIGAGHAVTALYEVVPVGVPLPEGMGSVDRLKYRRPARGSSDSELMTVKLRYKLPDGDKSTLLSQPVRDSNRKLQQASADFKLAAAVGWFGRLLRNRKASADRAYRQAVALAKAAQSNDRHGYRAELLRLITSARRLSRR